MKISESNVQMAATSQKTTAVRVSQSRTSVVTTMAFLEKNGLSIGDKKSLTGEDGAYLDLSEAAQKALEESNKQREDENKRNSLKNMSEQIRKSNESSRASWGGLAQSSRISDYRINLLEKFMQMFLGKNYKINDLNSWFTRNNQQSADSVNLNQVTGGGNQTLAVLSFSQLSIEYYESESVSFSAAANIKTEDGRSIDVELGLNMSRELYAKLDITSAEAGVMTFCDPLVINFDAAFAQLSDKKITFDLDCDGTSDQISTLMKGSGYLAIDDGSGEVKDGSQLFGTQSGDGFADLAKYDGDGNGWIDENDEIWDKLRIWVQDDDGGSRLIGLGEMGVGAIYLGNVRTNYSLTGESGDVNGMLRQTGFFLREDGSAGTVQHVDLRI